jgi:3-oxoacyl-[acyl-carrier protein] reductase
MTTSPTPPIDAASSVARRATAALRPIDIAVNAGGPQPVDPPPTRPAGRPPQLLTVTPIELATLLLPEMRERRWGRIGHPVGGVRQPIEPRHSNARRLRATA